MSEFAPRGIPDIERRPELDPSRKVEILSDEKIEVVDIFTLVQPEGGLVVNEKFFNAEEVKRAFVYAKKHAHEMRTSGIPGYLGTIIQHEDYRSV